MADERDDSLETMLDHGASGEAPLNFGELQAALHRIARIVAEEAPPSAVFEAVASEAARIFSADIAAIDRFDPDGMVTLLAARGVTVDAPALGSRTPLSETGNSARVQASGRSVRTDHYTEAYSAAGYRGGFRAAVSVPIVVANRLWGAMTVASGSEHAPFPPATEAGLSAMTELAALALANAEAHSALAKAAEEQAALRRIAVLVALGQSLETIFAQVSEAIAELMGGDAACVLSHEHDGTVSVRGAWHRSGGAGGALGERFGITPGERSQIAAGGLAQVVLGSGSAVATDCIAGPAATLEGRLQAGGLHSAVSSPIRVRSQVWGLVLVAAQSADALHLAGGESLEAFADLIAVAITSTQAHDELAASRARVVASADQARRQIERDLHDGAQQRLVAISLRLRAAQQLVADDQAELSALLEQISVGLAATLDELRELARGISPSILKRGDLQPALRVLARRSAVPVELAVDVEPRIPESAITTVYYTVAEALTNTAKHADATFARVEVRQHDGTLRLVIRDDGIGGADSSLGSGLIGLRDRIEAAAGTLSVHSPAGGGTELRVELPVDAGAEEGNAGASPEG